MTTYALAPNLTITIHDTSYTYRRFGRSVGVPLFLNMHFRGTMDHWDPALIDPLAARRPIILLDSAGVGRSGGTIPTTFAAWATIVIDFLLALKVDKIDVFGFSMGGCAAQMIALNAPKGLIRRVVLAGTMPSVGKGTIRAADMTPFNMLRKAVTREEQLEAFLKSFFGSSDRSQAAGRASFERIHSGRRGRTDYLGIEQTKRQGLTFVNFQDEARISEGSYARFAELEMPILIANGCNDLLLPTHNSVIMWQMLCNKNAQLHLYPDSGHGFLYQYAEQFAKLVNDFLDDEGIDTVKSRL